MHKLLERQVKKSTNKEGILDIDAFASLVAAAFNSPKKNP
jgi:hypothetical protein